MNDPLHDPLGGDPLGEQLEFEVKEEPFEFYEDSICWVSEGVTIIENGEEEYEEKEKLEGVPELPCKSGSSNRKVNNQYGTSNASKMVTLTRKDILHKYLSLKETQTFEQAVEKVVVEHQEKFNHTKNIKYTEVATLKHEFHKRWQKAQRSTSNFATRNEEWMKKEITLTDNTENVGFAKSEEYRSLDKQKRRAFAFKDASERTKRRKIQQLHQDKSTEELVYATQMKLRESGRIKAAKVCAETTVTSPRRPHKMLKKLNSREETPLSPHEALAVLINTNMSKSTYCYLRKVQNDRNCTLYPSYNSVLTAKETCYPANIAVSEFDAEVPLQNLLDHTVTSLLKCQKSALDILKLENDNDLELELTTKYGFDGSGNQALYAIKYEKDAHRDISESNLFATFIRPIKLVVKGTNTVIWQNSAPSSTAYCRPLRLQFDKETPDLIRLQLASVKKQITELQPSIEDRAKVHHKLILTRVDGKVIQALMKTPSAATCYLCHPATKPSAMNNLQEIKNKEVVREHSTFGISPLHLLINSMECILHIGCRKHLKTWAVKGVQAKTVFMREKMKIQTSLKEELGLNVDIPTHGNGTSNNGNTARRFFRDYEKTSEITGVDKELIRRFAVLLVALNSGYEIDCKAYEKFADDTAQLYVNLYGWYYMPVSLHKMLMHGFHVLQSMCIPVEQASEEAIEARHKDVRNIRLSQTCKTSRVRTNTDLIHWLLASSDPLVACHRKARYLKPEKSLSPDVIALLREPNIYDDDDDDD